MKTPHHTLCRLFQFEGDRRRGDPARDEEEAAAAAAAAAEEVNVLGLFGVFVRDDLKHKRRTIK